MIEPPQKSVLLVGNFLSAKLTYRCVCEDLAVRLEASGWKVTTTSSQTGKLSRMIDMVRTAWQARRQYAVAQVEVYSGPSFLWAEAVCAVLRCVGRPYVLALHGGNLPTFGRRWPGRVRRLLNSAQAVATPSRYLLQHMQPYRSDLLLLPNPLNLQGYHFRLRDQPQPRLVWLRALHEIYNPRMAARVLALLAPEFPEISLLMVGPDKGDGSMEATRKLAEELGVSERLETPGAVPKAEVPDWMQKGDIFLNTTTIDNTPISVMEAMACGLCVVSTNVGGLPYLLEDGEDSLLVDSDDAEAMAAAIRRILSEQGFAAKISQTARAHVENFDWGVVLPQWEKLFTSLIDAKKS